MSCCCLMTTAAAASCYQRITGDVNSNIKPFYLFNHRPRRRVSTTTLVARVSSSSTFNNNNNNNNSNYYCYYPKNNNILVAFGKKNSLLQQQDGIGDNDDDQFLLHDDDHDDELIEDDDDHGYFEEEDDYFADDEAEAFAGDGAGGGGISLAGTTWDKIALEIAEQVALSFDGQLGIYAFKTLLNATIQLRVERLTNKSGSPDMTDIEAFSRAYRARLDEAEATGSVPANISLEVSSPGVERVVRIPQDLDRFKDRNLYVKYVTEVTEESGSPSENDGIFRLVSYDSEANSCTWGLADVRVNREKSGKGRPLSKKQKEWRLITPFESLRLVRFYSEI